MKSEETSLKRHLLWRLLSLQGLLLAAFGFLIVLTMHATNLAKDEDNALEILRVALVREPDGRLALRATPDLRELREELPNLWFVIRDDRGQELRQGPVPPAFARIGPALDDVGQARLGWQWKDKSPVDGARMKRVDSDVGRVRILTTESGRVVSISNIARFVFPVFATVILPLWALMTFVTLIATPKVVRRALRSLDDVVAHARGLDVERRGTRLPEDRVPDEVRPLVSAVNEALGRYDEGYERRKRFLADAAHELRTPIAILNTRLESMPPSAERERLLQDVARLSLLAEQLLDLQRLDLRELQYETLDLVALGRRVAADMAPLAIAAGYDLGFEADPSPVRVEGDPVALERALTNLVQNAIEHGGQRGTITIRIAVAGIDGTMAVGDQGPGVPPDQRARIFEPFFRLHSQGRGTGLGLNLVHDIVRLHRGAVSVGDEPGGGACFRIALPLAREAMAPDSAD